jgi:hypothetical protein
VDIRKKQAELEGKYIALTPGIDKAALELTKQGVGDAIRFLTEYSVNQGQATFRAWKELYRSLFVTYMDGNIKTKVAGQMNPKVMQPGYGAAWYRKVSDATGEKLKVLSGSGH